MLESGNEGSITFTSDGAAHNAFITEKYSPSQNCSGICTEIVYPGHQPKVKIKASKADNDGERKDSNESVTAPTIPLSLIYPIHVRFNTLLVKQYRSLTIDKTLRIELNYNENIPQMTLIDVHKTLSLVGRHIGKLDFLSLNEEKDDTINARYLQQISKHCTNIQHMKFQVDIFRNDFIEYLKPIFKNLKALEIYARKSEVNPELKKSPEFAKIEKICWKIRIW